MASASSLNQKLKCWKSTEVCSIQAAIVFVTQITDQTSSQEDIRGRWPLWCSASIDPDSGSGTRCLSYYIYKGSTHYRVIRGINLLNLGTRLKVLFYLVILFIVKVEVPLLRIIVGQSPKG